MLDQNPQAKENHLKVEAMFVSFALRNLDARTEISLLTLGNILLLCPISIYFIFFANYSELSAIMKTCSCNKAPYPVMDQYHRYSYKR